MCSHRGGRRKSGDALRARPRPPLEGVTAWERELFGQPFVKSLHTPVWSDQTSQLGCGFNIVTCTADLGGVAVGP
jgi:hypothetical protein